MLQSCRRNVVAVRRRAVVVVVVVVVVAVPLLATTAAVCELDRRMNDRREGEAENCIVDTGDGREYLVLWRASRRGACRGRNAMWKI